MKNLCSPEIERYRIDHPAGQVPEDLRPWGGAFIVPFETREGFQRKRVNLRCIVSRGGYDGPDADGALERWDHLSVSVEGRCPTWAELEFVKRLFFERDECAMQLHVPPRDHINNHPYCLHIWRPLDVEIPRPPSIMVGHQPLGQVA